MGERLGLSPGKSHLSENTLMSSFELQHGANILTEKAEIEVQ
jgi:hypothetical protein